MLTTTRTCSHVPRCLMGAGVRPRATATRSCCLSCWPPVFWTGCTCWCTWLLARRKGMRLFDKGETPISLTLLSFETFETGILNLVYGPAESTDDEPMTTPRSTWPQLEQ
jgi:hypothetical protein